MIPSSNTVMKRPSTLFKIYFNVVLMHFPDALSIKVAYSQKQRGSTDCGLFAIAFATAIAFGLSPSKVKLRQEMMRAHLVHRFDKKCLSTFPTC